MLQLKQFIFNKTVQFTRRYIQKLVVFLLSVFFFGSPCRRENGGKTKVVIGGDEGREMNLRLLCAAAVTARQDQGGVIGIDTVSTHGLTHFPLKYIRGIPGNRKIFFVLTINLHNVFCLCIFRACVCAYSGPGQKRIPQRSFSPSPPPPSPRQRL